MSDTYLDKERVYVAYRDIFKGKLAKLRKRNKIRNVVEKHKDHFHHKQLTDSMDADKTCRILGDLLAARLFESESAVEATFPALFSPAEFGNGTALIAKCEEDGFEGECGQRDRTNSDAPPFPDTLPSPDTPIPNSASSESAPTVRQHRIDRQSGRIRKPTRATTKPTRAILQVGEGKEAVPKEAFREDREKSNEVPRHTRDCNIIPTNPTYLPFRLQHLILTQTQRLLEECCYNFAENWFPSLLEANGWEAPEAVELTEWWKTLSKYNIPTTAIDLSHGQSLAVLFKRVKSIRHCAVHRHPQIPVKKVEEMVQNAWLLSLALRDDSRATQLLHWHKELKSLVAHLQVRTNSQKDAAEAELRDIHKAKVEIEERLAALESRASQLTRSLEVEGRSHRPIDVEALQSLEEALSRPALAKALPLIAQDQTWQWIDNSVGMIINPKDAGAPKRLNLKVEPRGDQLLLRAPVLAANALCDSYEGLCGYMGKCGSLHKPPKCPREVDETEQEVFQGSVQDSRVTTRSMTLQRTAVKGYESFGLTLDMQTRAENETAGHMRPGVENGLQSASAERLQPSTLTRYPPDLVSTDDGDESTDYGTMPSDYEWE
ncbi:hypothetical protein G7Y89_g6566 [Cudoniella acicularis]|uniref:Uncharacterized protein n=1 Tax=Cudoniella acicularis TaxID=354080 RepID=A0A8H4RK89_9HELO|nr:hypothetical protein G7Y89_g6566 [Cudoniella acicularis]